MDSIYSFLNDNSYYVVLIITLIIWLGLYLYMRSVSKKIKKLEKK
jgi:lipoprotein signal peptidase